jgi:SAM-dependent methyltransferase
VAPHGLIMRRHLRQEAERAAAVVDRAQADRQRLLKSVALPDQTAVPFDYEAAVAFLVEDGLSEWQVRQGSMPQASLDFVSELLAKHLPAGHLLGLHVGNFVGISLAHLTAAMRARDEDALVVSIDPGMPHRGIQAPGQATLRLLDRFGLTANSLLVTGFTLARNLRDEGYVFSEDAPLTAISPDAAATALREDAACEQVLPNLARLLPGRFDVAVLDGSHDGDYLREELRHVDVALRPGGLLVIDDIHTTFWGGVRAAFEALSAEGSGYTQLGNDGRVGVLARMPGSATGSASKRRAASA